tara:strand:- start:1308 stop:2744 length:1437 start_codon:yes stop_codon:yes gene_type:complete
MKHKLGVIIPYREREEHLERFIEYFTEFMSDKKINYQIFVIEQYDLKPFNRGRLLNIGYKIAIQNGCDYVCFHDVDMLPEEVDYSYPTKPTHLASQLSNYNYGMPYDEYFGGVTLFNKYDFELVNGYSNEYIGWGFEDDDLLNRCYEKKLPMDIEWVGDPSKTTRPLTFVNFDGKKSFVEVHSKQIKSIFKDSYTISLWLKLDAIQDKKLNHYGIVSRPGYHTGIFIDRDNRLYCEMWSKNKKDDKTEWNVTSNIFGKDYFTQNTDSLLHLTMVHDKDNKILKFFINGKHVDNSPKNYMGDLYVHEDFPIYLGVAHPDYTEKSAFFKGAMTELCFWNTDLSDKEVRSIYNSSIPINPKRVNHDYKSIDNLVGYYDFKTHVQNKIFDVSENENHIFAKGTWFTAENLILGNYKISPHRRNGKYIVLPHEKTKGNEENHKLFLNKKDRKIDYLIDGLSTLKYKVVNKEKFMKKHWIYSAE